MFSNPFLTKVNIHMTVIINILTLTKVSIYRHPYIHTDMYTCITKLVTLYSTCLFYFVKFYKR